MIGGERASLFLNWTHRHARLIPTCGLDARFRSVDRRLKTRSVHAAPHPILTRTGGRLRAISLPVEEDGTRARSCF